PSPRNSAPAPSFSFSTSCLNDRSAIRRSCFAPRPRPSHASCAGSPRASIFLRRQMDRRVKPGDDRGARAPFDSSHCIIFHTNRYEKRKPLIWFARSRGNQVMRILIAALAAGLLASSATAQEVTLKAVTSFAEGTQFSKNFERFIEKVNADGKGFIKINYIGGPRAMPPFEVGNAVRTKVVDIANVTAAFYTNLMPEGDAFKLIGKPMSEQRANGTWALINELHNQKLNAYFLARQFHNVPFHIYLNKKPDKMDFTGLKIRVTPVYKDIVEAMGGTAITTAPGEVYTALERGVVDGYGWPVTGIFDLGWEKVTKYRLEPAFYSVEVNVLVNLDTWKGLTDAQRKVLTDAAAWLEGLDTENEALIKAERDKQTAA